jgi:hypothetical protein
MGRPKTSLTTHAACLLALGVLGGCGMPAQTASNSQYSAPDLAPAQPLIGSTATTLSAEFGQPALLRVDGTAQVWLYHSSSCGLNLILYPDASGTPRVAAASATDGAVPTGGASAGGAPADCTASLQQAHFDAAMNPAATSAALQVPVTVALEHPASS